MKDFKTGFKGSFSGYTVADSELRYTPKGEAVCSIRCAAGDREKKTDIWVTLEVWGSVGEKLHSMIEKSGQAISAEGTLKEKRWEYNEKQYKQLQLIYVNDIYVQQGLEMVKVVAEKKEPSEKKVAVPA